MRNPGKPTKCQRSGVEQMLHLSSERGKEVSANYKPVSLTVIPGIILQQSLKHRIASTVQLITGDQEAFSFKSYFTASSCCGDVPGGLIKEYHKYTPTVYFLSGVIQGMKIIPTEASKHLYQTVVLQENVRCGQWNS